MVTILTVLLACGGSSVELDDELERQARDTSSPADTAGDTSSPADTAGDTSSPACGGLVALEPGEAWVSWGSGATLVVEGCATRVSWSCPDWVVAVSDVDLVDGDLVGFNPTADWAVDYDGTCIASSDQGTFAVSVYFR